MTDDTFKELRSDLARRAEIAADASMSHSVRKEHLADLAVDFGLTHVDTVHSLLASHDDLAARLKAAEAENARLRAGLERIAPSSAIARALLTPTKESTDAP